MPLSRNRTEYLAIAALIVAMLIWSVSGIAIKHALAVLPPFTMIVLRFVPSVLLMLVIGLVRRDHSLFCLQRMEVKDLPLFLIAGFCQPFLYYLLETFTYDALNSPTIAETLLSTSPLLSPLFAAVLLRERVTKYTIYGILISTAGVFALSLAGGKAPMKYSSLSFVFYTQLISLFFFLPIWFWREGPSALMALDWYQSATFGSELNTALLCVSYLTVFASVTAFILFCFALRKVGVTQANAFNNIRPMFTALWMFLFFGEHLPAAKWVGMILIILGLFVCQKKEKIADS